MVIVIWVALCFLIAWGADQRGRSGVGWFFVSALVSPIIGVIVLVCLPVKVKEVEATRAQVVDDGENERLKAYIKQLEDKDVDKKDAV